MGIINRPTLWTAEENAFRALLATVFTITFSIALGQVFGAFCVLFLIAALLKRQVRFEMPGVMSLIIGFMMVAIGLSAWQGGMTGLWSRCGKLLWFGLIPVTTSLVRENNRARTLVLAFLAGCGVLGLKDLIVFPILAMKNPDPDFLTALIDKGSMTDGQMLMLALVGSVCLVVTEFKQAQRVRGLWWGLLLIQFAGLVINFKRGSWFCAIFLAGLIFMLQLKWRAWVLALLVMAAFFLLPPVQARMSQLKREFNVEGGGRLTMWLKIAPALIHEHPLGVGYGRLTNDMMRRVDPKVEPHRNHLHANWAQVLVETGWAGLGFYLAAMVTSIWNGIVWIRREFSGNKSGQWVAWASMLLLCGLMLNGLVEYNFGDTEMMFIYACVMGLSAAGRRESECCCP